MPASVNYSLPSSEVYAFESRTAFDNFLGDLNISDATTSTPGVVKQSSTVSFTRTTTWATNDFVTLQINPTTTKNVPEEATFEELRTDVIALNTALNSLIVALKNAGTVNS